MEAAAAAKDGLHGAFGFPIIGPGGFLGVMEFFSTDIREPDAAVLALFEGIGGQVGQFIERKRAEAELEREREVAAIERLLEHAAAARGQLVAVEGPAGIGKTTLLAAAATLARKRGATVLAARGSPLERALLAYTDALVLGFGRVDEAIFDAMREHLSDEAILEFTYITMMYTMHAVICRALRLEFDDRDDPIVEVPAPEGYVPQNLGRQIAYGIDQATSADE